MRNSMKAKKVEIAIEANPKGERKQLGGSNFDEWNDRLSNLVASAVPVNFKDHEEVQASSLAIFCGMIDINPVDPIEAILVGQVIAANEAALAMYRKGWSQPPEYFEARTKYLALADKAARTVMMLTERLDQHRGRGQQQIVVKHVTVNADQALVTDSVVTGTSVGRTALASPSNEPMAILEAAQPVAMGGGTKTK
jgi:hypothetical protein